MNDQLNNPAAQAGLDTTVLDVIYIAGAPRGGTTILDRVLGTLEGVASFNELNRLFRSRLSEQELCACGEPIGTCDFWRQVMERAAEGPDAMRRMEDLNMGVGQMRHFLRLYRGNFGPRFAQDLEEYRTRLGRLYRALADVSGKRILVDSSKVPSRALVLAGIPGIRVHVVHVVRDLRAVMYAWQKLKFDPSSGRPMLTFPPRRVIHLWYTHNLFSEMLASRMPYTRIHYEAFASNPRSELQSLVQRIGPLAKHTLPFQSEDSIELLPLHSVGGNPDRFRSGATRIRLDDAWVEKLPASRRWLATVTGYPLLMRYGYTGRFSPHSTAAGRRAAR